MGRGVSSGGGQSSLGYLFSDGQSPKPSTNNAQANPDREVVKSSLSARPSTTPPASVNMNVPAGVSSDKNNYMRADGQNAGNFITDRPSTKVQAAPGGGSSLGYLFGGGSN